MTVNCALVAVPPRTCVPSVAPAEPGDLPAVHRLLRDKAAFDGALPSFVLTLEDLRAAVDCEQLHVLVARLEGGIAGIATYYETFSTFRGRQALWLDDLFVAECHRRSGAGAALLHRLQCIADAGGYARIDWIVDRANTRGIAFYEAMGATVLDGLCLARIGPAPGGA